MREHQAAVKYKNPRDPEDFMKLASGSSLHLPAMPAEKNPPLYNGSAAGVIVFTVASCAAIETAAYFFGIIIYMS